MFIKFIAAMWNSTGTQVLELFIPVFFTQMWFQAAFHCWDDNSFFIVLHRTGVGLIKKVVAMKFWKEESGTIFLAINVETRWDTMSCHCIQDYSGFMKFSHSKRIISILLYIGGILSLSLKFGFRSLQCSCWPQCSGTISASPLKCRAHHSRPLGCCPREIINQI